MRNLILIFLLIISNIVYSQNSIYNEIGKNRIQYESFNWEVIYTNNFEVYYNSNSLNIAEITSKHLENNFSSLTNYVGHQPFQKTKVFIYNSDRDLNQSNIGINETDKFLSSNLNLNNRVIFKISFDENINKFKQNLDYEFCKVLIGDLMHGNMSFAKRFGKVSFINIPNWFSEGAARYLAYGWDINMDNVIRDYFLTENKKSINKITESQSKYIGQSIWNYISITYGKNTISNIINLTKLLRNPEKAIASSLGINFNNLINNWSNFYNSNIIQDFNRVITKPENRYSGVIDLKVDPNNEFILFSSIKKNHKKLSLVNKESNKIKIIDKSKNNNFEESYFFQWLDSENISYIKSIKGQNFLISQNIFSNKKIYKSLEKFDKIFGFSFNSNQNLIALSGSINNQSDIYLLSVNSENMKKITDDNAHDIFPSFFKNSTSMVFSSNRRKPILNNSEVETSDNYNLYIYNLDTTSNNLLPLTTNESVNIKSKTNSNNELLFLSDRNGIFNIYNLKINNELIQVTDNSTNIINFDYSKKDKLLSYNTLLEGENIIIEKQNIELDDKMSSQITSRKIYLESQKIADNQSLEILNQTTDKNVDF